MILPDPAKIAAYAIPGNERSYTASDALLYALGLGLGSDPVDLDEHPFVYEEWGPKVLPTLATVLGEDFRWLEDPAFGVGDAPNVHGDETLILHAPLKPEGRLASQSRIAGLYDRGPGSHGILIFEEELRDAATGTLVATRRQTDVLIGAGGFGGEPPPPADRPVLSLAKAFHLSTEMSLPSRDSTHREMESPSPSACKISNGSNSRPEFS